MAFTEFCCRSGGSNLNAGTRTGNSTEPGTSASFTYASGTWVQSTGVFTVASGNPSSDGVAAGDFASVYPDAASVTPFVGRVTARDATTITVSLTAKAGTAPADGTTNTTLKVGGAWLGPNGSSGFPFGTIQATLTNVAGDLPRVNFKNDATYSITAAISQANVQLCFQGYTSAYNDLGRAIIDGGTSGVSYILLAASGANCRYVDFIFRNNGASGSAAGVDCTGGVECLILRCVVNNVRGIGLILAGAAGQVVECEAYGCNQSNGTNSGISLTGNGNFAIRCISHDNTGSNTRGFTGGNTAALIKCIAHSNGGVGFHLTFSDIGGILIDSDAYNNGSDGILLPSSNPHAVYIENCNIVKNGGYGINYSGAGLCTGAVVNCGFGAGTMANTSGATSPTIASGSFGNMHAIGLVTYPNNVTPWVDPANGDFRINLAQAKSAGRGTFTETAASYAGTVAYPDIGAGQHLEGAGINRALLPSGLSAMG